jgi:gluconate 2-dehydrogenase alpha chain
MPEELRLKSHVTERYGASLIPSDMNLQDWGVTYDELEPHFDHFEYVCGIRTGQHLRAGVMAAANKSVG